MEYDTIEEINVDSMESSNNNNSVDPRQQCQTVRYFPEYFSIFSIDFVQGI